MGTLMEAAGRRTYLDANVLIYFLEASPEYSPRLLGLFEAIDRQEIEGFTSELSLAECLVKPFADGNLPRQKVYQDFLNASRSFQMMSISQSILLSAARMRATHKFRLADSIHLATALELSCDSFITNDQPLRGVQGITVVHLSNVAHPTI